MKLRKTHLFFISFILCLWVGMLDVVAQTMQIKGKIVDSNDEPIIGANVVVKGTANGVISDFDGNFMLEAPQNSTLVVSFIGYKTLEVKATKTYLDIKLADDTEVLDEVVVVGYGTQKKSDITGSVAVIKEQQLRQIPAGNIGTALQGMGAGIDVVKSKGNNHPGATPQIRIRGSRSLTAGNDPLIVVDGIPFGGTLNDIATDDIIGVQILKDASSTAIYGSRGANGVILITTRQGRNSKPVISYNGYVGFNKALGKYDMMNSKEFHQFKKWAEYFREQEGVYSGIDDPKLENAIFSGSADAQKGWEAGVDTDWQDLIYQNGLLTNHQVNVTGGSEKTQYSASLGYYRAEGNYAAHSFERYNLKLSLDQQIGKYIKIGINNITSVSFTDGADCNPMEPALQASPFLTPYKEDGSLWVELSNTNVYNPVMDLQEGRLVDEQKRLASFTSAYLDIDLTHGFKYKLNAGIQFSPEKKGKFYASETTKQKGSQSYTFNESGWGYNYTVENILTYDKTFAEAHKINFTGLYSVQQSQYERTYTHAKDMFYDDAWYHNNGFANGDITSDGAYEKWAILSWMGRLNYNYKDKYLATVTVRSDGSSRLAKGNQWSTFPSVALGWNIGNESFMKNVKWINSLKLRTSYGTVGNTAIDAYATMGDLATNKYNFGSTNAIGVYPNKVPNPNLTWEKTSTFNVGVDFGFLNGRITGSLEYYHQWTKDLLLSQKLPGTTGTDASFMQNIGKTENTGMELNISSVNFNGDGKDTFSWVTDFNIFFNRGKITELASGVKEDIGSGWFVGEALNIVYDYKRVGIWQNTPEDIAEAKRLGLTVTGPSSVIGTVRVADTDHNDKINAEDKVILGRRTPKFEGGMTNRFGYKNFDFSIVTNFRVGGLLWSGLHSSWVNTFQGIYNNINLDYWTTENSTNYWPKPHGGKQSPDYRSTLCYFDASYLKIRSMTLGYTVPENWTSRFGVKNVRLYTTVSNPFTFFSEYINDFGGLDPETSGNIDLGTPACWSMLFGLNFSF